MSFLRQPHVLLSTAAVVTLTTLWGYIRLVIFHDTVFPLTFVLPLFICVWSRQRWHLWVMAAAFVGMTVVKVQLLAEAGTDEHLGWFVGSTLFNIIFGAAVVHMIMAYRDRVEEAHARISAQNAELELQAERLLQQNAELETQAEELSQQNEEIRAQSEELAQQHEEVEAQSEELAQQNEELTDANQRLAKREELLQSMLESSRTPLAATGSLADICRRALAIMGAPAEAVVVLEKEEQLVLRASAGEIPGLPERWPIEGSLARVVFDENRTAYVSKLAAEPALSAPFGASGPVQSMLATPLHIAGKREGIVAACSTKPTHWTTEHFRLLEWLSAQCGLILESHRWQAALRRHAGDAEAANQAKDRFLAMLSHELRTPLTPVLAAAGALANDQTLAPAVREELAMIRRNVSIQNRLIDDLLDLTRISRGKLVLERERVGLLALVRSAIDITAPDLDARNQRFSIDLGALDGCIVDGDGARLQQILWNLLKNAVKFSPPGGEIIVTAGRYDGRGWIRVKDHGVGLAPDDLERIFLPFEQVGTEGRPNEGGGLGLGLAIARNIAELHGGSLRAESAGAGHGATFTFELPVLTNEPPADPGRPKPVAQPAVVRTPLRILLVEDHADTARVLARLLQGAGHQVRTAHSGGDALGVFQPGGFDLLLSDLGLPDIDGCELIRQIRVRDPGLHAVCMSGYGAEKDVQRARAAGFAEHLTKPVELQHLHAAVARVGRRAENVRPSSGSA